MKLSQIRRDRWRAGAVAAAMCLALTTASCSAGDTTGATSDDATASFPEDVTIIVPFGSGGGTDTWARFMAPYLEEAIGGTELTAENVTGSEGIAGTNQYVRESEGDGSTVLMATATSYFQNLLGRPEADYDFAQLQPLVISGTGAALYTSAASGIESVEELQTTSETLRYGGASATGLDTTLLLLFEVFDLDVETTFGFESRGDIRLALQRGELNLDFQTTSAYLTQVQPLVDEGKAVPLMSFGVLDESGNIVRDPNLPNLPTPVEVYEEINGEEPSGPAWEAYKAFHAVGFAYQKGLWTTPDTPEVVREAYYSAARSLQDDEAFLSAAAEVLGGYPLYAGDTVEPALRDAFQLEDEERNFVLDLLAEKYDTVLD